MTRRALDAIMASLLGLGLVLLLLAGWRIAGLTGVSVVGGLAALVAGALISTVEPLEPVDDRTTTEAPRAGPVSIPDNATAADVKRAIGRRNA